MSDSERDGKVRAQRDREDIAALGRYVPFTRYFLRRLNKQVEEARERVLHNTTEIDTPEKLWQERLSYLALHGVATMPERDDADCCKMLEIPREGSEPGDLG